MKVQKIQTQRGYRYIVLDNEYRPIEEINSYLKYLDLLNKSVATIKTYASHLKHYAEYLDTLNLTIKGIFEQEKTYFEILTDYVAYLQYEQVKNRHRTTKTVNYMMVPVCEMYEYLSGLKVVPEVRLHRIENAANAAVINKSFLYETTHKSERKSNLFHLKVTDDERFEYINVEQFECLLKACRNLRDKILLALLFECGLRIGEALGIRLSDIFLAEGEIQILHRENNANEARVKNKAEGTVYLPDYVIDWLIEFISVELIEYDTDYLFINLYGENKGAPMTKSNVESLFGRLSKTTGIKVHPHMLRHGFGTLASESDIKPEVIQQMMRHKNINTTMKYVHVTNDRRKDAAIKIQEAKGSSVEFLRDKLGENHE